MLGELGLFLGDADAAEERVTESLDLSRSSALPSTVRLASPLSAASRRSAESRTRLRAEFAEADELRAGAAPEAPERAVLDRFQVGRVGRTPWERVPSRLPLFATRARLSSRLIQAEEELGCADDFEGTGGTFEDAADERLEEGEGSRARSQVCTR